MTTEIRNIDDGEMLEVRTDYKQLCAELVAWAEKTSAHYYSEPEVLIRARAALAEPEESTDVTEQQGNT